MFHNRLIYIIKYQKDTGYTLITKKGKRYNMIHSIFLYIAENWVSWIFLMISSVIGIGYRQIAIRQKTEQKKSEAIGNGIQALLRNEIIDKHNQYIDKGYCPIYGKENIKRMYDPYHVLGGNDIATDLVKDVMELPAESIKGNSNAL